MGILVIPRLREHISSIVTESGNTLFWKDETVNSILKRTPAQQEDLIPPPAPFINNGDIK